MKEWGRLLTAMVTPFDKDMNVDYEKAVELANKIVDEGTTALVVVGTTGESPTVTSEEKYELFRILKNKVNVPIIAGIGTNCTRATIELGKLAEMSKADGALVVVPYYNRPNQQGLYEHFKTVAESIDLPIMPYNVPSRTGGNMEADTSIALSKISNIVAIKEASGNMDQITKIIAGCHEDFLVYSGDDGFTLPTMCAGGYGVVSVVAQVAGRKMRDMIDLYVNGHIDKAAKIHQELNPLFNALFITTNPIPVKAALNLMGMEVGRPRLPLVEADEKVKETLKVELQALGLL
ncbi:MAG: 4-hydroxy-tetrahydrodipicolinate synthase [Clostridiales bacterium]|nr:4-hydroxy-tetrahydrodipicolinate synthase [Clostridiales bacterium]